MADFKFPDEIDDKSNFVDYAAGADVLIEDKDTPEFEIEIEEDTPPEDRRTPMPQEVKEEVEAATSDDELEKYDQKTKERFRQLKRLYHDERREKERLAKEKDEAVIVAQKAHARATKLQSTLDYGAKEYATVAKSAAEHQLTAAEKDYREAYDSGDSEKLVEAQKKLTAAQIKLEQANQFRPESLQNPEDDVKPNASTPEAVRYHPRTQAWMDDNQWYGKDPVMTATAQGVHIQLQREYGNDYVGSDEYFKKVDSEIRKRYPEHFQSSETKTSPKKQAPNVVAPATRATTQPKKVTLNPRQVALIKKLGITPEGYVKQYLNLQE